MAEAFVKTFKRDYVYLNDVADAETVLNALPGWPEDYNCNHQMLCCNTPKRSATLVTEYPLQ